MAIAKVSSAGRITIPAEVRKELSIDTGDVIQFIKTIDGYYFIKAARDVSQLKGCVRAKRTVSIEEMNFAIKRKKVGL